jgi:hypothetical protein
MNKKHCDTCIYHAIHSPTYRDICDKEKNELIIPDAVMNWIKSFGCASWKEDKL